MGDPIPQGEGTILGENVAAHRKIMGHSTVSCAKMDDLIAMPFWMKTRVGPRNHVLDGGADPLTGKHNFLNFVGLSGPFKFSAAIAAFAAKEIIQSPITSCSRRDHSVCQASANRNPENSEQCCLSAGKG